MTAAIAARATRAKQWSSASMPPSATRAAIRGGAAPRLPIFARSIASATATTSRAGSRSTPATRTGAAAGATTGAAGTTATPATTPADPTARYGMAGGWTSITAASAGFEPAPPPARGRGTAVQGVASLNRLVAGHEGRRVRRPDRGNAVMALKTNTCAAATAVAAAFSLLATPAAAIELPKSLAVDAFDGEGWNAERDRRRRWDRGRYRHRNGI